MDAPLLVNPDLQPKLAEWFSSASNMTWLDSVLNTPEGKLLVDVLREHALPAERDLVGVGDASYLDRLAVSHAKQVGIRACVEVLVSLRHPVEPPRELPEQWESEEFSP